MKELKAKWFFFGFVSGGSAVLLLAFFILALPQRRQNERTIEHIQRSTESFQNAAKIASDCLAKFQRDTVLTEFEPSGGLKLGPVKIQAADEHGQLIGGTRARWLIPADVSPTVIGEPNGVAYYHFNRKTRELEGPFIPEVAK